MKIVLLDTATLGEDIDLSPVYALGEVTEYKHTTPDEVAERIADAEAVMLNKVKLNAENLPCAPKLKLICVTATGYDNIDTDYCKAHGIALCNVPGYSTDSVAQLTVAIALSLACHLPTYRDFVHSGAYTASGTANRLIPVYHELSAMTWGIVGGGAIGTKVAEIAEALGAHVLVCRRTKQSRFEQTDLDDLCQRADIISLHVPLTDQTRGMLGREQIEKMKTGTILLNTARGAVTDEEALADAIETGKLGGLGVDVYSTEPFGKEHPFTRLLDRPNVCLTPHMAWGAYEARNRCARIIADNIRAFTEGKNQNRIV